MSSRVRVKLHPYKERKLKARTRKKAAKPLSQAEWVAGANKFYDEQEEEARLEEARRREDPEHYEHLRRERLRKEFVIDVLGDDPEGEDTGQIRDLTALADVYFDE